MHVISGWKRLGQVNGTHELSQGKDALYYLFDRCKQCFRSYQIDFGPRKTRSINFRYCRIQHVEKAYSPVSITAPLELAPDGAYLLPGATTNVTLFEIVGSKEYPVWEGGCSCLFYRFPSLLVSNSCLTSYRRSASYLLWKTDEVICRGCFAIKRVFSISLWYRAWYYAIFHC